MTVVVTGASGFLGTALVAALRGDGERVISLVRREPRGADEASWDPARGTLDPGALTGARAVVHLAGASIGERRWTTRRKREIVHSRVSGTRTLARAVAAMDEPPEALLSGSGIHYYGDTGDRVVDESGAKGEGFLADLAERWEAETEPAARAGVRVALLRTSLVLSGRGGSLARMLPIFRMGLGAPLGTGRQYWPWITIDDWVGAVRHVLATPELAGPVNLTAPEPVTNATFTRELGRAMRRPVMPIATPAFALRLGLGEFAREGVLSGPRAVPAGLLAAGYRFRHERLGPALAAVL